MKEEFCPKCQSILIPEKTSEGKLIVKCGECGFTRDYKGKSLVAKEKLPKKKKVGKKILDEENEFADYKHKCPKCGYGKAQVIDLGIQYSDEDNLLLLKCGKCGWSERIGEKVS